MLPLGSGRTSLMSTGQGLSAPKPPSRPSSLSSAIGKWVFLLLFSVCVCVCVWAIPTCRVYCMTIVIILYVYERGKVINSIQQKKNTLCLVLNPRQYPEKLQIVQMYRPRLHRTRPPSTLWNLLRMLELLESTVHARASCFMSFMIMDLRRKRKRLWVARD